THAVDGARGEAVGKPSVARVYTNQRLNLSKPWEGTRRTCQGLEPDPGNLAVRDFRGASRNVRHGETVNPPCNRKSRTGNPSPTAGRARSLSQPSASFEARSAPRSFPTARGSRRILPFQQFADRALGLVDGQMRIRIPACIGIGNGDAPNGLAGAPERLFVIVAIEQRVRHVSIAMG